MRTTLDIDDTVLAAARSLARSRGISIGAAVSQLALEGLRPAHLPAVDIVHSPFPVIVGEGVLVTDELVNGLRDG